MASNPSASGRCKSFNSKLTCRAHKSTLRSLVEQKYNFSRREEITLSKSPHYTRWRSKKIDLSGREPIRSLTVYMKINLSQNVNFDVRCTFSEKLLFTVYGGRSTLRLETLAVVVESRVRILMPLKTREKKLMYVKSADGPPMVWWGSSESGVPPQLSSSSLDRGPKLSGLSP
ncbi:hypothetical protein TNCV_4823241 [Trichonephila clavipes]|nr:hypothetical protein TNCV_4823241 [Trichonephila clavipes]